MTTERYVEISRVLLERKDLVYVPSCDTSNINQNYLREVLTLSKNLECLGYKLSDDLIMALSCDSEDIAVDNYPKCIYDTILDTIKERVGVTVTYKPMYPGFPKQVMEMDEFALYFNALRHYLTDGEWLPNYHTSEYTTRNIKRFGKLKTINVVRETVEYDTIVDNLVKSRTSLSDSDKTILTNAIQMGMYEDITNNLHGDLKSICEYKEIRCLVQVLLVNKDINFYNRMILSGFDTVTDVLRFAVALSDGDVSLAEPSKFNKFSRAQRRLILKGINNVCRKCLVDTSNNPSVMFNEIRFSNIVEEGANHRMQFIRLGEICHPGADDMKNKYPLAARFFDELRNNKIPKYLGSVDKAIYERDTDKVINLLSMRPGVFARQLDRLLRMEWIDADKVITAFRDVAKDISTTVLYQVAAHFRDVIKESVQDDLRVFFPKGNTQKAFVKRNTKPEMLSGQCANKIISICNSAIQTQYVFENREYLGGVYVNPEMANYIVPFSQRSASTGSRTLARGSKVNFADSSTDVLRAFVHWTNGIEGCDNSRIDIDLSASLYDENFSFIEHCSYTRLQSGSKMVHSGDITDGGPVDGEGVAEFLDFNMSSIENDPHVRYLVFSVYSYSGQHFSQMINATFGWMNREFVGDNDAIFQPSQVVDRIVLDQNASSIIPVVFDVREKCFVWTDLTGSNSTNRFTSNNIENSIKGTSSALYAVTHITKPTMMDVIKNNVHARGVFVDNIEDADVVFDLEKGDDEDITYVTPYDTDVWMRLI